MPFWMAFIEGLCGVTILMTIVVAVCSHWDREDQYASIWDGATDDAHGYMDVLKRDATEILQVTFKRGATETTFVANSHEATGGER